MLCYETNLVLDVTRDNIEFLKKKPGAERLKFLSNYFFISYDVAKYAMQSFKNDAFIILFDIVEKKGDIDVLSYMHENDTAIHLPFVSIREMDLARFKRYEEEIKNLESRLKAIENGIAKLSDSIFGNWLDSVSLEEGDANDSAEAGLPLPQSLFEYQTP